MSGNTSLDFIADTLQMCLHQKGSTAWGKDTVQLELGPLSIELFVKAYSDVIGFTESAMFAHVTGDLWLYILSKPTKTLMYIIDGNQANLFDQNAFTYGPGSTLKTLIRLSKADAIKAVFRYGNDVEGWKMLTGESFQKEIPEV